MIVLLGMLPAPNGLVQSSVTEKSNNNFDIY
jgi:hypothetical protein